MASFAILTSVRKLSVILFGAAVHTNHHVSISPRMVLTIIMAFIAAVVLVTARRDHPVGHIFNVGAFIRDFPVSSDYPLLGNILEVAF